MISEFGKFGAYSYDPDPKPGGFVAEFSTYALTRFDKIDKERAEVFK